jgi:hypothetical protein
VLTGRPPVDGTELIQLVVEATDPSRRPTPRARGTPVTNAVEAVFARALSIDPRARHAHIEQMWEALTKAAADASRLGTAAIPSAEPRSPPVPTAPMPASSARASRSVPPTAPMQAVRAPEPLPLAAPGPRAVPPPAVYGPPPGPPVGPTLWRPPAPTPAPFPGRPAAGDGPNRVMVILITLGVSVFFLLFLLMLLLR